MQPLRYIFYIVENYLHLHDDCLYGWDTLAKCGAKYMVIDRPKT